jgi:hypothetical protein
MYHQNAIIAMLVIMSIAALTGVFTVQVADAQLPSLTVSARGVSVGTEEFGLNADAAGVQLRTEEFGLNADAAGVGFITEEFGISANPVSGVNIRPPPEP